MNTQPESRSTAQGGFTIIEVMIALVVLSVGVLALLGSSAMVTRMIGAGRHSTEAVEVANSRMEQLRRAAYSTTPPCTHAQFAGGTSSGTGFTETWVITAAPNDVRVVSDTVTYATTRGQRPFVLTTRILCR